MRNAVLADNLLRDLAMATARNNVGAQRPIAEVAAGEGITLQEYNEIARNPVFLRYVDVYTTELSENGFSFAAKSRILAEDLLPTAYHMAKDLEVPAATRLKAIENLVEWGGLKPKNTSVDTGTGGFSITINIPAAGTPAGADSAQKEPHKGHTITVQAQPQLAERVEPLTKLLEADDYEYAGDDYYE